MPTMLVLMLGLLTAAPAPAQEPPDQEEHAQPAPEQDGGASANQEDASEPEGPVSLAIEDARLNFGTVVESFIAQHSAGGYWPLKQKTSGKLLKLKFVKTYPKSIREVRLGHYIGRAGLSEIETGEDVQTLFTVDFSGSIWKVEQMRLVSIRPPAGKPPRKAPVRKAGAGEGRPVQDSPPAPPAEEEKPADQP